MNQSETRNAASLLSSILDRRIAELETRLDELRAIRKLLEPASVPVLPAQAVPREVAEPETEPERKPAPNVERRAERSEPAPLPAVNGRVKEKEKAPAKKPGQPSGPLTQLMKERCLIIARLLADGPLTRGAIIARSGISDSVMNGLLQQFGSPPRPTPSAFFKKTGEDHYAPWALTELGRRVCRLGRPVR